MNKKTKITTQSKPWTASRKLTTATLALLGAMYILVPLFAYPNESSSLSIYLPTRHGSGGYIDLSLFGFFVFNTAVILLIALLNTIAHLISRSEKEQKTWGYKNSNGLRTVSYVIPAIFYITPITMATITTASNNLIPTGLIGIIIVCVILVLLYRSHKKVSQEMKRIQKIKKG